MRGITYIGTRGYQTQVKVSRIADLMLPTDVLDGPSCSHRFQDHDDLVFAEFCSSWSLPEFIESLESIATHFLSAEETPVFQHRIKFLRQLD